ncbi:MAG TPA: Hsp20/alpha crystallin family protein [Candidatus Hydrogenedentes bacterium]|nr:Hsp20/alpha crystallin family protein [Candidatus Hydrogenedentota bacterium]HOL77111.1 Hsp20/alpha crystallin family protein [Candidatus Hydrogenedentota bacterium]HPO86970.1 Hsp20/alpha crystallin family protein [Candidatus Hydrogenedentota bacterium]
MMWDLVRELESLRREMERAFENFGADFGIHPWFRTAFLPGRAARAYPMLNISEDRDAVYVEALAPGLDTETLEISVLNNRLRIAGEKQALSKDIKPEAFHRSERSAGRFVRTIDLPTEVDAEKVTAEYKNGMLLITLPKAEAAKPKQITVKVA